MESAEHFVIAADILRALQDRISHLELKALGPDIEPTHLPEWKKAVPDPGMPQNPDWYAVQVPEGAAVVRHPDPNMHYEPSNPGQHIVIHNPTRPSILKKHGNKRVLPDHVVRRFVQEFNQYWQEEFGLHINFTFHNEDIENLTITDPALARNMFLQKFFIKPPVIFECFAGVGADTITFLHDFNPKAIYTVQRAMLLATAEEVRSYDTLQNNIRNFILAVPGIRDDVVKFSPISIQTYIAHMAKSTLVDLLYLDPPWRLDGVKECTPTELIEFLNAAVFAPLAQNKIVPRVICIKTRFGRDQIDPIQALFPAYRLDTCLECQPLQNIFYFHIFALKGTVDAVYQRGSVFKRILDTGKRLRVVNPPSGSATVANVDTYQHPKKRVQRDRDLPQLTVK